MYKEKSDQQQYQADWYQRNKEEVKRKAKITNAKAKSRNREYIRRLKTENPCVDCGNFFHFAAMDFDHIGTDKIMNVARLSNSAYSIEKIDREIAKCELVCSNCHRIRTYERLQE